MTPKTTPFDPLSFVGIRRSDRPLMLRGATAVVPDPVDLSPWVEAKRPSWVQSAVSCGGHATANAIEDLIIRAFGTEALGPHEQIDGELIWREVRKRRYGGDMNGGVQLHEPLEIAIEIGLLPPSTTVKRIDANIGAVSDAVRFGPLVQGTCVHGGWARPNSRNGCIADGYMPNPMAGHATEICGTRLFAGVWFILFFNSWGPTWGWHGYGMLPVWQWQQCLLDDPMQFQVVEHDLKTWDGWKRAIVKKES